jgi:hypothetical protein
MIEGTPVKELGMIQKLVDRMEEEQTRETISIKAHTSGALELFFQPDPVARIYCI